LFDAEEKYKEQEDWNLLYVAATRAKELLIISGVASRINASEDGVVAGSWYARLQIEQAIQLDDADNMAIASGEEYFVLPVFDPPVLAAAESTDVLAAKNEHAIDEGIALHTLMERMTQDLVQWPVNVPDADIIADWLCCPHGMASAVRAHALTILGNPRLERFFNPMLYRHACNEMDVLFNGEYLRFDRVVQFDDAVWILDYKRNVSDSDLQAHKAQLTCYREAARAVYRDKKIKAALIAVDGGFWEVTD
jgi:ATP-dependent helicase/nuclease subunit A